MINQSCPFGENRGPVWYAIYHQLLVGGWATPLKNMKVNWDDDIPNIWENNPHVPNHHALSRFSCGQSLRELCPSWALLNRGQRDQRKRVTPGRKRK